jgi:hypothetical protein
VGWWLSGGASGYGGVLLQDLADSFERAGGVVALRVQTLRKAKEEAEESDSHVDDY